MPLLVVMIVSVSQVLDHLHLADEDATTSLKTTSSCQTRCVQQPSRSPDATSLSPARLRNSQLTALSHTSLARQEQAVKEIQLCTRTTDLPYRTP